MYEFNLQFADGMLLHLYVQVYNVNPLQYKCIVHYMYM